MEVQSFGAKQMPVLGDQFNSRRLLRQGASLDARAGARQPFDRRLEIAEDCSLATIENNSFRHKNPETVEVGMTHVREQDAAQRGVDEHAVFDRIGERPARVERARGRRTPSIE
jgi:hypothetical protein